MRHPFALKVAYHDACHLAHAQGVREPPRELLRSIPELELVEPDEWQICCGSAGIYNLVQPEAAAKLGGARPTTSPPPSPTPSPRPTRAAPCRSPGTSKGKLPIYHPMTLLDASQRNLRPEEVR